MLHSSLKGTCWWSPKKLFHTACFGLSSFTRCRKKHAFQSLTTTIARLRYGIVHITRRCVQNRVSLLSAMSSIRYEQTFSTDCLSLLICTTTHPGQLVKLFGKWDNQLDEKPAICTRSFLVGGLGKTELSMPSLCTTPLHFVQKI